ncbi:MAG: DASS family sodium-coupled anion symporter [Bacteroidetes bacterium]|nr:DASS family sodium-coupled anion symporter [Bacteroidota bacterium]MBV6461632.1 Sodium-dependent dicarboxylate transporter SdcS [Flavobacteriales bacterium]WKZ74110.1 MAG: DASS family sodium-coupled anion symporter [Vicingaceae bacterium]MCL4816783.1 DASS family sodium-coupled anion symporter [Flavobacteriales bacterium]NOG95721.1 DASS family sodium-coupled anion symporter [Bacteroidota bacterium]
MFTVKKIGLLLGIITASSIFYLGAKENSIAYKSLAVASLMIIWWVTEALPIFLTSLLPIILFPLLGINEIKETASHYANPVIYLFMGGFMIAIAMEKWNLHKRIALSIIRYTGTNANSIIFGFMLSTYFLSMWLSNTATAVMMLPIGVSIVNLCINESNCNTKSARNFAICMMLGIAYGANIGGIATLIGTPPNLVLLAYIREMYNYEISFTDWLIFGIPLSFALLYLTYLLSIKIMFPNTLGIISGSSDIIENEMKKLGVFSVQEKRVLSIFIFTALLWILREQINKIEFLESLNDSMIALIGAFLLFMIPADKEKKMLLIWEDMSRLPWGILLLFGGGLSLASGMEKAGVLDHIGTWVTHLNLSHAFLMMILLTGIALFLTEVMSNVALATVFIPVVCIIAEGMGKNVLYLSVPVTIASSCAFMLPMSTPPNAIVFGSGHLKIADMAKAGLVLNILSIILITLVAYFILPIDFSFEP